MIRYTEGNLLEAGVEAVVNTVNTVGVMGKGIALMFKEVYPDNFKEYVAACKRKEVQVGRMFVTENRALNGPKWIINFPTKQHWRFPTKMDWVEDGLKDLRRVIEEKSIRSIAVPPLGCGNGGLDWRRVRPIVEEKLGRIENVDVLVFEPTSKYQNQRKKSGEIKLTPARALISELIRRYWILGIGCTNLEVQKLAWFLQRVVNQMGLKDPLDVVFKPHKYGPYADDLRHLLNSLDGSYLHCEKRLSDARPTDMIWFEDSRKQVLHDYMYKGEGQPYLEALEKTTQIIDGFESPLGMELLATVDWLLSVEEHKPSVDSIKDGLRNWHGEKTAADRKLRIFEDRMIELALDRLQESAVAYRSC